MTVLRLSRDHFEGDRVQIVFVEAAVQQRHFDVDEWVTRHEATLDGTLDALAHRRDELPGMLPPRVASTKLIPFPWGPYLMWTRSNAWTILP
jgi:hypothetical protein